MIRSDLAQQLRLVRRRDGADEAFLLGAREQHRHRRLWRLARELVEHRQRRRRAGEVVADAAEEASSPSRGPPWSHMPGAPGSTGPFTSANAPPGPCGRADV
jgi:hypothetical protein